MKILIYLTTLSIFILGCNTDSSSTTPDCMSNNNLENCTETHSKIHTLDSILFYTNDTTNTKENDELLGILFDCFDDNCK